MPNRTIYIRQEDIDTWEAIPKEKRPEWLHMVLQEYAERKTRTIKLPQFDKPIKVPSHKDICPNGHITDQWGYCMSKGCKYAR